MKSKFVYVSLVLGVSVTACAPGGALAPARGNAGAPPTTSDGGAIVNGHNVGKKDAVGKSVVALVAQRSDQQALCTGTLISEDTVLTAAHCVDEKPETLAIVFGANVKTAAKKAANIRVASGYAQNPHWQKNVDKNRGDLALVHFEGGLPTGFDAAQLVDKKFKLAEGTKVTMVGYGVTDGDASQGAGVLRETETSVIGKISRTEFATDGRESSVCFGDSGGPAFVSVDGELLQWGIASSVTSHACNETSVHTAVMSYLSWIKATSAKLKKAAEAGGTGADSGDEAAAPKKRAHKRKPTELLTSLDDERGI